LKIRRILESSASEANYLAIGALLCLLLKVLVLNRFPALFVGAYELGIIVEAVLTSVIASYIFYFIVVHLTSFREHEHIEPFVQKHLTQMVGDAHGVLAAISNASSIELKLSTLTKQELHDALLKIPANSPSQLMLFTQHPQTRAASWMEFFQYRSNRSKTSALKLLRHVTLIGAKRIRLITAIDDCSYFIQIEQMIALPISSSSNLSFLDSTLYKYFGLCQELHIMEQMAEP
jgi:hypothetical protein